MNEITLFTAFGLSAIMAPIIQQLFFKLNKIDEINQRSSHSVIASRTGGVSSFITVFIISIVWYAAAIEPYDFSLLVPLSMMFFITI